ncbi:helix-turn-helix transcriptional regulator [Actinoallomurus sp. NPDC052308]|uniref:helix-turn-helix domain-containing protein n=1 Tax=Actinoallomurus sp. NPDC052308 TaxID=3155530 RepID=UPI003412EBDC
MAGDRRDPVYDKRRRLAGELRVLRDMSGVSGRDLAKRIGISQSKVSRIEAGTAQPSAAEITAWARAVGASDETERLLAALDEIARTGVEAWQAALEGRPHLQDEIREREETAQRIRNFQPAFVPGLLQTSGYAQRVFAMFKSSVPGTSVAAAVAARLDRQLALYEGDREYEFLITEAALRWRPGPPRLAIAQLDRVATVSTLDNVSVGLIPLSAEAEAPYLQGFSILDDGDAGDDALVLIELDHAPLTVTDADDVAIYQNRWSTLRKTAVFGDEAQAFLRELTAQMRTIES